jgi:pimeloyl-ACP methyl ester carboxylesterase
MGGAIVQVLALNYPEHVLGLGLIASGAKLKVAPQLLDFSASPRTFLNAVDMVISWSFSKSASDKLKELSTERMGEVRPSVLHSDFLACDAFDVSERLPDILTPTIVVCGAEDKMTPVRFSQHLVDNIPDAHLEILPDAGHMVMLEKPEEVAEVLRAFMGDITYGYNLKNEK